MNKWVEVFKINANLNSNFAVKSWVLRDMHHRFAGGGCVLGKILCCPSGLAL